MKSKGRQGRKSTSFSPPKENKNNQNSRHSVSSLNLNDNQKNPNETLFETLMSDPVKRTLVLQLLSQEKDNIERYKRNEEKKTHAKLRNERLLHCESPTALLRRRALQKVRRASDSSLSDKSDSKSATPSPVPFDHLLNGVFAYVEIRSKFGDRSAGAKALMRSMGATVMDHFGREVTHVVFKDGSFNTYQKAKLMKVHLVSVLWLEAIRKNNVRVPEKTYPALGTEAYDIDISAICQDYEEIVLDEYRRSLAVEASNSNIHLKGRKTCIPSELKSMQSSSSGTSSASYHTAEKSKEVVPSSQDWESESVISHESVYPPFRRAVPTVKYEGSDLLLSSDSDSECGVIDGHSIRNIADSLLDDLNIKNEEFQNINKTDAENVDGLEIGVQTNRPSTSTNSSSNLSVSLLSRKSVPKRKSSYSVVDMDLTNVKKAGTSVDKKRLKLTSRRSYITKNNSGDLPDNSKASDLPTIKRRTSKRKTISSISDLKMDISKDPMVTNAGNTGRSARSLYEILSKKSTINLEVNELHVKKRKGQTSEPVNHTRKSERKRITVDAIESVESQTNIEGGNSSKGEVQMLKNTSSKSLEQGCNKNSVNSENISPLRLSADDLNDLVAKDVTGNKRKSSDIPNQIVHTSAENREESSLNSEMLPSLRISSDSSNNTEKGKSNGSRRSSRISVILQNNNKKLNQRDRSSTNCTDDNINLNLQATNLKSANAKDSLNSEDLPPLRISTDSATKGTENNDPQLTPDLPVNSDYVPIINGTSENVTTAAELSKSFGKNSDNSFCSSNSGPCKTVMNDNIIPNSKGLEEHSSERPKRGEGEHDVSKKQNFESIERKTSKPKAEQGKNRKLRKLYNLNQSISDTFKNWDVNNVVKGSTPEKNILPAKKQLIVSLTPLFITHNVNKVLTNQKLNRRNILREESKLKEQQALQKKKKVEKPQKPKNVQINDSKDEQKELANEYVLGKEPASNRASKRKHNIQEDNNSSPKKQVTPVECRRSQRILHSQKPLHESSLNASKLPIIPQVNRRSSLEFVQPNLAKTKKTLTQRSRKVKPSIVCTRMHKPEVQTFMQIVKKLGVFFVQDEVTEKTTHLVVGESKRTINLLRAIARGCWIITKEWLFKSLEAGRWLPEEDYELTEFTNSVQQCRKQRQAFGPLYSMDLFENCGPIYIARGTTPRCSDLEELVTLCKGTLIKASHNASVVVGDWVRYSNVTCVNEKWILDSVTFNKKKPFKNYLIKPKN